MSTNLLCAINYWKILHCWDIVLNPDNELKSVKLPTSITSNVMTVKVNVDTICTINASSHMLLCFKTKRFRMGGSEIKFHKSYMPFE